VLLAKFKFFNSGHALSGVSAKTFGNSAQVTKEA
jgi:hypothetical protein